MQHTAGDGERPNRSPRQLKRDRLRAKRGRKANVRRLRKRRPQ